MAANKNNGKPMLLWKCAKCDSKKSSYIKQRKARVLSFGDILPFKGIAIVITTS